MTKEGSRHEFFQDLKKLLKSSESNYLHGRSYIGQKKLIESHRRISEFLGDNLPGVRARGEQKILKTAEQVKARIESVQEVILFAKLIRLDTVAIANLESFIQILEWVLAEDKK